MTKWFNILMARLGALFRRETVLRDIEEELRVHVEMETETNIKRGIPPDEARAAALKSFGALSRNTELGYDIRGGGWLETLWQDLRYGTRMLLKTPTSTLIAIITLALGIGANTAIFSVINAALIRSLPFAEADRLVMIWQTHPDIPRVGPAFPDFEDWRARSQSFQEMEVYSFRRYGNSLLTGYGDPVQIRGALASSRLFTMLGASPILGRVFLPEEEKPGADRVVILIGGPTSRDLRRTYPAQV
jgi:putative ABC transport system permease protein